MGTDPQAPDSRLRTPDSPAVWPVVATRGRPEWLRRQLERLAPQLIDGERIVVVVDGGTPDVPVIRSFEAVKAAADVYGDDRFEVVPIAYSDGDVDRARRIGNTLVPADAVVCEIDDHDLAEPDLLAELRAVFTDPPDGPRYRTLVAGCDVYHSDPEGKVRQLRTKDAWVSFRESGNRMGFGLRAYRKWAYDCVGGYPLEHFPVNDYALMCRLEQFGGDGCVATIRKPLVTVIEDSAGISARHRDEQTREGLRVANVMLAGGFELPFALVAEQGVRSPESGATDSGLKTHGSLSDWSRRPVPKLVHFVWVGPEMPAWARDNVERLRRLNPEFQVLTHGEEILLPALKPGYEAIAGEHEWSRKSDLLRVSALVKFGGWYVDCDFLPFRPLTDIYADHDDFPTGCFLTQGTPELVANGVIATAVASPFLELVREELAELAGQAVVRPWGAFGPALYTRLARRHPELVTVGAMERFYPLQRAEESRLAYVRLTEAGCAAEAVDAEFAGLEAVPYMLHMSMQDEVELPAAEAVA